MPLPQQFEAPEQKRTPEIESSPEGAAERREYSSPVERHETQPTQVAYPQSSAPQTAPVDPIVELHRSVEHVLEGNLQDVFQSMPAERQAQFRAAGEQTAKKITTMLTSARVAVQSILKLIRSWLKMIPGVNRYYLEQEAKIKSDQIMALYRNQQGK